MLADGSVFEGEMLGADPPGGVATGEVVFNTVLSGYQEVITDPSYAGQIITFTYPHIGNCGDQSHRRRVATTVLPGRHRARPRPPAQQPPVRERPRFDAARAGVPAIGGIDTRRLTRLIRDTGALPGAFGTVSEADLLEAARAEPGTDGIDLVAQVTTDRAYTVESVAGDVDAEAGRRPFVVAYDFGIKRTILRNLGGFARVEVVPASTTAADVLARQPDGVFLSNGPGDPTTVPYAVDAIRGLLGSVPIFGICLGHQLLGLAIGAGTVKLPFGHHGGNHPVKNLVTGRIEITSQNHNFAVAAEGLSGIADMTHVNLNDGVCEGMRVAGEQAFSVQHHPEAGPGPHDSRYLFEQFAAMLDGGVLDGGVRA